MRHGSATAPALPLEPLQAQIVDVITLHPEYHPLLEAADAPAATAVPGGENPYLHLSLHLALREQAGHQPPGRHYRGPPRACSVRSGPTMPPNTA